jgi:hypothetical protein
MHSGAPFPRWLTCAACRGRIDISALSWVEYRDGTIKHSLLRLTAEERRSAWRVVHDDCLIPDFVPDG